MYCVGQGFKAAGAVERSVKVLPSSEAASISMTYRKDDKTDVSIKNRQDISVVAGELLRGISKYHSHRHVVTFIGTWSQLLSHLLSFVTNSLSHRENIHSI